MTRRGLILLAAVVWCVAGFNVVRMGLQTWGALPSPHHPLLFVGAVATFVPFAAMFLKLTAKNVRRIAAFPERKNPFWQFMSPRSYLIMAFMIALGVVLRNFTATPRTFIAAFYVGLGSALFVAGMAYLVPGKRT